MMMGVDMIEPPYISIESPPAIYRDVVTYDLKNFARTQGTQLAGNIVWFREVAGGVEKLGRVVGYRFGTLNVVSPSSVYITMTANVRLGHWYYTAVDVYLVDGQQKVDKGRPHSCPVCSSPAFILFRTVECSNTSCKHYRA
jgi:hypothetical protein